MFLWVLIAVGAWQDRPSNDLFPLTPEQQSSFRCMVLCGVRSSKKVDCLESTTEANYIALSTALREVTSSYISLTGIERPRVPCSFGGVVRRLQSL